MTARLLFSLLFFTLLLPLAIFAQPPFQTSDLSTQLNVVFPKLETYAVNQSATVHFHVFDVDGLPLDNTTISCYFHLYNGSDMHIYSQQMVYDVTEFEAALNTSLLSRVGEYPYTAFCYNSTIGGYASGSFLVATDGVTETVPFSWVLLSFLPILFGFLIVVGARLFDPLEHWILHVTAYLLSIVSTFVGSWFAVLTVVKFTEWGEMQNAFGTWTWASGLMFFAIVAYWLIYIFYRLVNVAAQKKERRLEQ